MGKSCCRRSRAEDSGGRVQERRGRGLRLFGSESPRDGRGIARCIEDAGVCRGRPSRRAGAGYAAVFDFWRKRISGIAPGDDGLYSRETGPCHTMALGCWGGSATQSGATTGRHAIFRIPPPRQTVVGQAMPGANDAEAECYEGGCSRSARLAEAPSGDAKSLGRVRRRLCRGQTRRWAPLDKEDPGGGTRDGKRSRRRRRQRGTKMEESEVMGEGDQDGNGDGDGGGW